MPHEAGRLAVVLHDIEPATFGHCALIRDWLADLGVDRVTLCVVPAPDHHPFFRRSPALADWLRERRAGGDAIAQQGLVSGRTPPRHATTEQVSAGRRLLEEAGLEPSGYRAGTLAHALTARRDVGTMFRWWMAAGRFPVASERGAVRVDLRPEDFDRLPDRTRAMERALRRAAAAREVVTFDDLAAADAAGRVPALRAVAHR
jgi:hypothetical protein